MELLVGDTVDIIGPGETGIVMPTPKNLLEQGERNVMLVPSGSVITFLETSLEFVYRPETR